MIERLETEFAQLVLDHRSDHELILDYERVHERPFPLACSLRVGGASRHITPFLVGAT
jgi:hypothetical protein